MYWANYRLEHAQKRLEELGPLSQLRRHGRKQKAATLDQVETFTGDVRRAEAKVADCERTVEELRPERDLRQRWDADHGWPDSRLRTVEAEITELEQPAQRSPSRQASLLSRVPDRHQPAWLDQLAEIARPPLPGPDPGHGIDLGP